MSQPHDFQQCLARSHAAADLPIWEEMYRQAFPDFSDMHDHRANGYWQAAGIDRTVILLSSRVVYIDEKVRGRNQLTGLVYDDIALEYVSNNVRNTPGWVEKPLRAEYIAYAIAPLGVGYLLPVLQLQKAWLANKDRWLKEYRCIEARNSGYSTLSVCIPAEKLFPAIGQQLRLTFQALEWPPCPPSLSPPKEAPKLTVLSAKTTSKVRTLFDWQEEQEGA